MPDMGRYESITSTPRLDRTLLRMGEDRRENTESFCRSLCGEAGGLTNLAVPIACITGITGLVLGAASCQVHPSALGGLCILYGAPVAGCSTYRLVRQVFSAFFPSEINEAPLLREVHG